MQDWYPRVLDEGKQVVAPDIRKPLQPKQMRRMLWLPLLIPENLLHQLLLPRFNKVQLWYWPRYFQMKFLDCLVSIISLVHIEVRPILKIYWANPFYLFRRSRSLRQSIGKFRCARCPLEEDNCFGSVLVVLSIVRRTTPTHQRHSKLRSQRNYKTLWSTPQSVLFFPFVSCLLESLVVISTVFLSLFRAADLLRWKWITCCDGYWLETSAIKTHRWKTWLGRWRISSQLLQHVIHFHVGSQWNIYYDHRWSPSQHILTANIKYYKVIDLRGDSQIRQDSF
jgi:hypothetical protein